MAKYTPATDEQLGQFSRKLIDLERRASKGSIDVNVATRIIQLMMDGNLNELMYPDGRDHRYSNEGIESPKRLYFLNSDLGWDMQFSDKLDSPCTMRGLIVQEHFFLRVRDKKLTQDRNRYEFGALISSNVPQGEDFEMPLAPLYDTHLANTWISGYSLNSSDEGETGIVTEWFSKYSALGLTLKNMSTVEILVAAPNGYFASVEIPLDNLKGIVMNDGSINATNLAARRKEFVASWKKFTQAL